MTKSTISIIFIIAMIISFFGQSINSLIIIVLWVILLLFAINKLNQRATLFAFSISFFTFILGRFLVKSITDVLPFDGFNVYLDFSDNTTNFIYKTLIVSIVFIFLGYISGEKLNANTKKRSYIRNDRYFYKVRNLSRYLVYVTFAFNIMEILERVYYAGSNGYFEYYTSFRQNMPYIVCKLSSFFVYSVFLNLATLPSKKEAKPIVLLYIFSSLVQLLVGARGAIMYPLLITLIYYFVRTNLTPEDPWITNKGKTVIIILAPVVCVLMSAIALIRNGDSASGLNFTDAIISFFFKQGTSYQIIGFVHDQYNFIPSDQIYSIGRIFHIFDGSIIGEVLGIDHHLTNQTAEYAFKGDELGSLVTYLYNPSLFIGGAGFGSCYIAEAYADLNWPGIIIVNFLVGYLMAKVPLWMSNNLWLTVIAFFMLYSFIRAPRGSAFGFLGEVLNINYIILSFVIHFISKKNSSIITK